MADQPVTDRVVSDFVDKIRKLIYPEIPLRPPNLFNADLSGFQYELKFNFTLARKGERYVKEKISNKNAQTHSYTTMPLIDSDGNFIFPHLLILQEPKGKFGPRVQETMFKHRDILITCTESGKMTKKIMDQWYRDIVFKSHALHNNILLLDSYGIHKDDCLLQQNKPPGFNLRVEFIPAGTTGTLQSLDNDLNRTFKEFVRYLSVHYFKGMAGVERAPAVHTRDFICLFQVLMYNQCSSPRFKGWVQHSFKLCKYTDYDKNPVKYCTGNTIARSACNFCDGFKAAFLRCGWCTQYFCRFHFFFNGNAHYCTNYIE